MPYRFKRKESVPKSVHRIVAEQAERAAAELGGGNPDIHDAVHNARKHFKKIRSVLRLLRRELGDRTYRWENDWFRDAAHRLGGARDAEAMIETFDQLAERYESLRDDGPLAQFRVDLLSRRERIIGEQQALPELARELSVQLHEVPKRLQDWSLKRKGFNAIASDLERSYRHGRKALHKAAGKPTDHRFHQWRKRVKDYWYHNRLLRRCWPALMEARVGELRRLSDLLGDDHDLAILRSTLKQEQDEFGEASPLVACLAARRQDELRAEACALGMRLYASAPACELDHLEALWRSWKGG